MRKVVVSASKEYEVIIDKGIIDHVGKYIRERAKGRIAAIITDDTVDGLYGDRVYNSLVENDYILIIKRN